MVAKRIERLLATPRTVANLVAEAGDAELDAQRIAGEWNARTILAHLRDDEFLCMRPALERALAEEMPTVYFIEGADWQSSRSLRRERKEWLLADFALQRQASVSILHLLAPSDWERAMYSPRHGRLTITGLVDVWIQHSEEHVAQLEAVLGETLVEVLARRAQWPRREE